jgi:WD40 repeat protein
MIRLQGALLLLIAGLAGGADAPGKQRAQLIDRYGDPLPPGAIARLGTVRLRHQGITEALAFSPDGKLLAARSADSVILFDPASGQEVRRIAEGLAFRMGPTIAFTPDGKNLVYDRGDAVVFSDVTDGKTVRSFQKPAEDWNPESAMSLSADGKFLAAATGGRWTGVFDAATGTMLHRLRAPGGQISTVTFAPDARTLAVSCLNKVELWDAASGKLVRTIQASKDRPVGSIAFSFEGKTMASGTSGAIAQWDPATGKEVGRFEKPEIASVVAIAYASDGKSLIYATENGTLRVLDLARNKERLVIDTNSRIGRCLALAPDGKTVAVGSNESAIRMWDISTGRELLSELDGHDARVNAVAFTPDGKTLISAAENRQIRLWNTASWRQSGARKGGARSLCVSPDSKHLAAVEIYGLRVWDLTADREDFAIALPGNIEMKQAGYAPDGKTLISLNWTPGGLDNPVGSSAVATWEAATGKGLREFPAGRFWIQGSALTSDGRTAAAATAGAIHVLNYPEGNGFPLAGAPEAYTPALAFTPDGRLLVSGSLDLSLRLWEVASGQEVLSFMGHQRGVAAVAVSPDSRLLASSSGRPLLFRDLNRSKAPRKVRLWDMATGQQIATFAGHAEDVTCLAFTPDGNRLVSGFVNGTVLVWDITPTQRGLRRQEIQLNPETLAQLWADLAGPDARKAYRAVVALAQGPAQAVPFLRERLRPAVSESTRLASLIESLDSSSFEEREKASKDLELLIDLAAPKLRATLQGKPSAEVRRRCEALLEKLHGPLPPGDVLRWVRAVQALEQMETRDAVLLLRELAKGTAGARITEEAKRSIARLRGGQGAIP